MGGCRCSYKSCLNTTKTTDNIHFFHFPVKHRETCGIWIDNSEKPSFFDLEEEQLRNKVLCELHFEEKCFQNHHKKRLVPGAIPTLDGNCQGDMHLKQKMESEPVYAPSNQYSDVKVVPANDDGTVFVLDTDNMFTISPKIQSYIIKNGILVPATSNGSSTSLPGKLIKQSSPRFVKPSSDREGYIVEAEKEIANINTPPGASKVLIRNVLNNQEDTHSNGSLNSTSTVTGPKQSKSKFDAESTSSSTLTRLNPSQGHVQSHAKPTVTKSYLRQIKKHSRDIANIKRMLKQKRIVEQTKPDVKMILNELQEHQIPPSLVTIISLLLGVKTDLCEEDIEFFTSLHKSSPQVYQTLSDKYKWNLPSVDIVVVDQSE